jgi:hypothetical protein
MEQQARGGKQCLHLRWWTHLHPRLHSTPVSMQGNGKGIQRQRQICRAACSARCYTHSTSPVARVHPRPCTHHRHACAGTRFRCECEYERLRRVLAPSMARRTRCPHPRCRCGTLPRLSGRSSYRSDAAPDTVALHSGHSHPRVCCTATHSNGRRAGVLPWRRSTKAQGSEPCT